MKKNRVYAGIDLDALRYNMESMHKNIKEGTKIAAVIKADAYGHGALTVAKTIEDLPYVWGFAVATADEAEMLIADGRKKPILILGISFPEHYELIVEKEIRPAICEYALHSISTSASFCRRNFSMKLMRLLRSMALAMKGGKGLLWPS